MRSAVFLSFAVCFVSVIAAIPVVPFSFDDVHQGQCCAIIYLYKLSDYYVYTKGYNNNPLTIHANAKISSPCNIPFFFLNILVGLFFCLIFWVDFTLYAFYAFMRLLIAVL